MNAWFDLALNFCLDYQNQLPIWLHNESKLILCLICLIICLENLAPCFFFLPGDSLLFLLGMLASEKKLPMTLLNFCTIACTTAIISYRVNYFLGKHSRHFIVNLPWIKPEHIQKTQSFYHKKGAYGILIARFMPIIRSFLPFFAGSFAMPIKAFWFANTLGALIWIFGLCFAGYYLGHINWIQQHLNLSIISIIVLSLLPSIWQIKNEKST